MEKQNDIQFLTEIISIDYKDDNNIKLVKEVITLDKAKEVEIIDEVINIPAFGPYNHLKEKEKELTRIKKINTRLADEHSQMKTYMNTFIGFIAANNQTKKAMYSQNNDATNETKEYESSSDDNDTNSDLSTSRSRSRTRSRSRPRSRLMSRSHTRSRSRSRSRSMSRSYTRSRSRSRSKLSSSEDDTSTGYLSSENEEDTEQSTSYKSI